MKWGFVLMVLGTAALTAVADPTKNVSHSKGATSASKTSTSKKGHTTRKRTGHAKHSPPAPSYQLHPDPERYQQIQQALADRGYFKGQANGEWGDDSVDALKRFQADQKIDPDGKINAPSLIGLGLGPKHDGSMVTPVAPVPGASNQPSLPAQTVSGPQAVSSGAAPSSPSGPPK